MSTTKLTPWKTTLIALALLACTSTQIGCSPARPISFYTGQDYIILRKGQSFEADRDMALATESVIQEKDQKILDLLKANAELQRRLDDVLSR